MAMGVPALSIELDPLIAEAKQHARRRRYLLGTLAVIAAGALTYGLLPSGRSGGAGSQSLPESLVGRLEFAARHQEPVRGAGGVGGGVFFAATDDAVSLTTDGGRTWRDAPGSGLIQFVNRRYGWIQKGPWLYRTTDGARSWARVQLTGIRTPGQSLPNFARNMSFVNRTVGFLSVAPGYPHGSAGPYRLLATHDGGLTWHARGPLPPGSYYARQFDSARTGYTRTASVVYSTTDGGRTWAPIRSSPPCPGTLEGGHYQGTVQIWRCGIALHVTTDGGSSWVVRRAPYIVLSRGFDVLSARTWVSGIHGPRFFMTTSAGRTWAEHRLVTPRHWTIALLTFTSARTAWAIFGREPPGGNASLFGPWVGRPAFRATVLMRTTDGGKHWTPAGPPKPKGQKRG